MGEDKIFLAADSGGSKTVWMLLDSYGNVLSRYKTAGVAAIKEGILPVLKTVEEAYCEIKKFGIPQSIFFSLGGPNVEEVENALRSCWGNDMPVCVEREACGNSILNAAKFLDCSAVVMCGTGSVAVGHTADGQKYSGGWGPIYGDDGSGGGMGSQALKIYLNHIDNGNDIGRLPEIFAPLIDGLDISKFADRMELKNRAVNMPRRELAALAPEIYHLAEAGDKCALSLYRDAAKSIAEFARNVSDNVEGCKVLLCGGFFSNKPILLELCKEELSKISRATLEYIPQFSPIVAAQISALENKNIRINKEIFTKILNN